ncbi:MAG TPA: HTH domain-containing protein [Nitrososphaeraceae archaeon]|nr:HTH domain-containing protein [Nitrososphaeraceae archaeon]
MHKPSPVLRKLERGTSNTIENEDLEHQDRLAKVLMFHSRGYSQSEIARKLNVNQSTVSRDIAELRKKARGSLDLYVKEEIPNEFQFYISGLNQIIKNLWDIIEDKQNTKITVKDRTYVLSLLMQCYSRRIEMLVGGPDMKMNAKKHIDDIQFKERYP